jgi:hypothetical protein
MLLARRRCQITLRTVSLRQQGAYASTQFHKKLDGVERPRLKRIFKLFMVRMIVQELGEKKLPTPYNQLVFSISLWQLYPENRRN